MNKLFKWLRDNSLLDESKYSVFEEEIRTARDEVPELEKFSTLLLAEVEQHRFLEYEDYTEGMFSSLRLGQICSSWRMLRYLLNLRCQWW